MSISAVAIPNMSQLRNKKPTTTARPPRLIEARQSTRDFLTRLKEDRWSILNISYLMNRYTPQEINDLMLFWVNAVHKYGGVHFVLMLQGAHDERQVTFLKNLVDGVLSFKFVEGFQQTEGEVEIQKLRRVLPKSKSFRHIVQSDGLVVETTARIG